MAGLLTIADLAVELNMPEPLVRDLYRANDWPSVRFSNKTIRFTREHVDQIIALHSRGQVSEPAPARPSVVTAIGIKQTSRSKARTGS